MLRYPATLIAAFLLAPSAAIAQDVDVAAESNPATLLTVFDEFTGTQDGVTIALRLNPSLRYRYEKRDSASGDVLVQENGTVDVDFISTDQAVLIIAGDTIAFWDRDTVTFAGKRPFELHRVEPCEVEKFGETCAMTR